MHHESVTIVDLYGRLKESHKFIAEITTSSIQVNLRDYKKVFLDISWHPLHFERKNSSQFFEICCNSIIWIFKSATSTQAQYNLSLVFEILFSYIEKKFGNFLYVMMNKILKKFNCIINTLLIPDARGGGRDRVAKEGC